MNNLDVGAELDILNAKRNALEQGLRIAALIERLNGSLDAAFIAKRPGSLPQDAVRYYERLDELSRALPNPLLKARIASLGTEVERDFHHILFITRLVKGAAPTPEADSDISDVDGFLGGFADHSARLVGLRVALYKRGESSAALKLAIPTEALSQRLHTVSNLQSHCRSKVRNEIKGLRSDTRQLLKRGDLEPATRTRLQGALEDLQTALRHIDEGGDIAEIPVVVETLSWEPEPMSTRELAELLKGEEVEELTLEEIVITAPGQPEEVPAPSFRDTLHLWLNTPPDVSWDRIKSWQRQRPRD